MHVPHISNLLSVLWLDPDGTTVVVWPYRASSSRRWLDGSRGPAAPSDEDWSAVVSVTPGEADRCEVTFASGAPVRVGEAALAFLDEQGPLCWRKLPQERVPLAPPSRGLLPPVPRWKQLSEPAAAAPSAANTRLGSGSSAEANWVPTQTFDGRLVAGDIERLTERVLRGPLLLSDGHRTAKDIARVLFRRRLTEDDALELTLRCLRRLHHLQLIQ